jgi:hypothetical protein
MPMSRLQHRPDPENPKVHTASERSLQNAIEAWKIRDRTYAVEVKTRSQIYFKSSKQKEQFCVAMLKNKTLSRKKR